jgi:hypothetical protein
VVYLQYYCVSLCSMWGRAFCMRICIYLLRGCSNFQYIFSTDGFVLICFVGSSEKFRMHIVGL